MKLKLTIMVIRPTYWKQSLNEETRAVWIWQCWRLWQLVVWWKCTDFSEDASATIIGWGSSVWMEPARLSETSTSLSQNTQRCCPQYCCLCDCSTDRLSCVKNGVLSAMLGYSDCDAAVIDRRAELNSWSPACVWPCLCCDVRCVRLNKWLVWPTAELKCGKKIAPVKCLLTYCCSVQCMLQRAASRNILGTVYSTFWLWCCLPFVQVVLWDVLCVLLLVVLCVLL